MQKVSDKSARRLNDLKKRKVIAGWQDAGGPNYGLSKAPLPALIFPLSEGPASTFYDERKLVMAISALETFGPTDFLRVHA